VKHWLICDLATAGIPLMEEWTSSVSQDDQALGLSQFIWGGMPRIGDINPEQEPYRDILAQQQITVFDLTKLAGEAHSRAFDDITKVVVMVREQLNEEPVVTAGSKIAGARVR
jgi:esterase/lipase superfamily enzyme